MRRASNRPSIDPEEEPARGILQAGQTQPFRLIRLAPSEDLAAFIEHFWLVEWELAGLPPRRVETLPHPTQHVVIDPSGTTGIFGLQRAKFTHELTGSSRALGMKFRPGAFRGFFGKPVSEATDKVLPIEDVFGASDAGLEAEFLTLDEPEAMVNTMETMLRSRRPDPDPKSTEAASIVSLIEDTPELYSVSALADLTGMSARALQRLFDGYVGAGPKWVIDRYRMIEALEALNAGVQTSLTDLAYELGYFDQAHFTKTFQSLTGYSPSEYQKT